jgi:uncharacterized membrane protein YphA (DoxX/SURF4 family)
MPDLAQSTHMTLELLAQPIPIDWVLLVVRIILGTCLIYYGWPKIKDPRANARDFIGMGFKPGWLWGSIAILTEFFGGLAILSGIWVELGAALFGFQMMIGTLWKRKNNVPYTDYSYDLLLFALCITLMRLGAGTLGVLAFPLDFLRWDIAILTIIIAPIPAHLPEILGKRYQRWKG